MDDYSIGALMFLTLSGIGSAAWWLMRKTWDRVFAQGDGLLTLLVTHWIAVATDLRDGFNRVERKIENLARERTSV
jgi:hypothetical protein